MPTVRTRFQPAVDLDVSDAEAAVLRAQGLLADPEPAAPDAPDAPAPAEPGATKTPAAPERQPARQDPAPDDPKDA